MNAVEFGRALVETNDLDPIYVMLNRAELDWDTTARFSLAYWMFYHPGVAARLAEPDEDFWEGCQLALDNRWPRGSERRHFRGALAQSALDDLWTKYSTPEEAVRYLCNFGEQDPDEPRTYTEMMARVQEWRGFGPWIAFKVADMVDAVLGTEVDFNGAEHDFYESPVKAGCWVAMETMGMTFDRFTFERKWDEATPAMKTVHLKAALTYLASELGTMICPHNPTRTLRLQEYETILCKYKSHLKGKYPVGTDTKELLHMIEWGAERSMLGKQLQTVLREVAR